MFVLTALRVWLGEDAPVTAVFSASTSRETPSSRSYAGTCTVAASVREKVEGSPFAVLLYGPVAEADVPRVVAGIHAFAPWRGVAGSYPASWPRDEVLSKVAAAL